MSLSFELDVDSLSVGSNRSFENNLSSEEVVSVNGASCDCLLHLDRDELIHSKFQKGEFLEHSSYSEKKFSSIDCCTSSNKDCFQNAFENT